MADGNGYCRGAVFRDGPQNCRNHQVQGNRPQFTKSVRPEAEQIELQTRWVQPEKSPHSFNYIATDRLSNNPNRASRAAYSAAPVRACYRSVGVTSETTPRPGAMMRFIQYLRHGQRKCVGHLLEPPGAESWVGRAKLPLFRRAMAGYNPPPQSKRCPRSKPAQWPSIRFSSWQPY